MASRAATTTPAQPYVEQMGLPTFADAKMLGLAFLIGLAVYELIKGSAEGSQTRTYGAIGVLVGAYLVATRLKAHEDKKRR